MYILLTPHLCKFSKHRLYITNLAAHGERSLFALVKNDEVRHVTFSARCSEIKVRHSLFWATSQIFQQILHQVEQIRNALSERVSECVCVDTWHLIICWANTRLYLHHLLVGLTARALSLFAPLSLSPHLDAAAASSQNVTHSRLFSSRYRRGAHRSR
jgi:hypothetical protein